MKMCNFRGRLRAFLLTATLLLLAGCGKVDLLSNLPEKEANEILSIMQQYNVPALKKAGLELTWTIMLSNGGDFSRAVNILNSMGYPNTQYNTIGQVFQKSGLVSSPLEERARFMYALSETIADTLNKIPGVLSSRVHIVLPENDPYSDSSTEASAAIFLTYKAGGNLDESVREIKYLVANSVQGLDYDRVSIALFPVAFDAENQRANMPDPNVSVLGLKMAGDAAPKFLIVVIVLAVLMLSFLGLAVFLFLELRKRKKKGGAPATNAQPARAVVQSDEEAMSDLDEAAPEAVAEEPEDKK
jgi:type III secretion protein J